MINPHAVSSNSLVKIGVFYDGNYFLHVSNYYNYQHERNSRINIGGLHEFIRHQVAQEEGVELRHCRVVDAHYFRGRISAYEAQSEQTNNSSRLFHERVFDDILMQEGVVTHYLPVKVRNGRREEKGIDVWLALEALELTMFKKFDVVVLIACDGDYLPLIRKVNTLGSRVMLLSWDFSYTNTNGQETVTRTSQELLEEATYPIAMHEMIDNRLKKNDPIINNLFTPYITQPIIQAPKKIKAEAGNTFVSTIRTLNKGYGFISYTPDNIFFHYTDVEGDFHDLQVNDVVEFAIDWMERIEKDGTRRNMQIARNIKRTDSSRLYDHSEESIFDDNEDTE